MNKTSGQGQLKALSYCDLGIGFKCNYKCKMCRMWQNNPLSNANVLSIQEWKDILTQIAQLPKKKGCMINFSGAGEALLREGIFEVDLSE